MLPNANSSPLLNQQFLWLSRISFEKQQNISSTISYTLYILNFYYNVYYFMMDFCIVDIVVENGIIYLHFADTGHTNHSGNLFEVYVELQLQNNL